MQESIRTTEVDRESIRTQLGEIESLRRDIQALRQVRDDLESNVAGLATALDEAEEESEAVALDLGKLSADLWLFSTTEFGFLKLPVAFTTGSSLMPQKRNPDLIELMRGRARNMIADRAALLDTLRDLPSGYHRDFQLVKPPLFRAHDTAAELLPLLARFLDALEFNESALKEATRDPALQATAEALARIAEGETFRDAYHSMRPSAGESS